MAIDQFGTTFVSKRFFSSACCMTYHQEEKHL
jgi:hypothetical protein